MADVITIDGPAGSGKSTVARILAKRLGYIYLDTGAMYRAVALMIKEKGISVEDKEKIKKLCESLRIRFSYESDPPKIFVNEVDVTSKIRTSEIDMLSSIISQIKEVRDAMTRLQREIAQRENTVAEGRDMGTVVFPDARRKFFLTASLPVRVMRRYKERREKGEDVSLKQIEDELRKRDMQDQMRSISPLKPAKDAIIIDTTDMSIEEVVERLISYIENC